MNLETLSYRQMLALGKTLKDHAPKHGEAGDFHRDPRTNTAAAFREYLASNYTDDERAEAWRIFVSGEWKQGTRTEPKGETPSKPKIEPLDLDRFMDGAQSKPQADAGQSQGIPMPAPKPQSSTQGAIDALVQQIAQQAASEACNEDRVRQIAQEEIAKAAPRGDGTVPAREIVLKRHELPDVRIDGAHPLFEKVLRLCSVGLNVMLVGPAGCGKTHLAGQIAKALNVPFNSLSYSAGASESWLLGRLLPTGEQGKFEYQSSVFCQNYERPSVFLHDEIDAGDANMLLTLNAATANGAFDNPVSGTRLHRHPQAVQIAAANTFGNGAGSQYVGRSQLDAATLDRWYIVTMTYDPAFEASLCGMPYKAATPFQAADAPSPDEIRHFGEWVARIRASAESAKLRRVVSTRMLQKALLARSAGIPQSEIKRDLLNGWTTDELAKVGERA
jgi:cobaltochelatase CobS